MQGLHGGNRVDGGESHYDLVLLRGAYATPPKMFSLW
jgi:hypothetical protein